MKKGHSFHIPVMGIGYTIDSPLKVAHFGMDSVISLVDDILLEKLRKLYSDKFQIPYKEISDKIEDFRAKRITSYLNLMNDLVDKKFEDLKHLTTEKKNEISDYFNMLPDSSTLKNEFRKITENSFNINHIKNWVNNNLSKGSIDVNIMTKIDKDNFKDNVKLPTEYNDAHAAVRGFANSDLSSTLILSAGMNPGLYSYLELFDDFYPDENGMIKKKIALKVSDYRSALIQGKYLAKKGIWVSEYRIESGLNCGGHAFATEGYLLGPILEEFKNNRKEMVQIIQEILIKSLSEKNRIIPKSELTVKISAQGGVGTSEEHQFLIDQYQIDSVGWGSPFLLVPEATSVDKSTLKKLADANEDDLYLSGISPLGVPFNNLRGNTKDLEKDVLIAKQRPGSSCPKKYVALNKEFTENGICSASRQYQHLKIQQLDQEQLSSEDFKKRHAKIVEKACICVGLGTSALLTHDLETKREGEGVAICPGPNIAYFCKTMALKDITNHIYGRANLISRTDRPHMFIKELNIYIDYLKTQIEETQITLTKKQEKYLKAFTENLKVGIDYYQSMFNDLKDRFQDTRSAIFSELNFSKKRLLLLEIQIKYISNY